jgi:hypothetical protein
MLPPKEDELVDAAQKNKNKKQTKKQLFIVRVIINT